MNYLDRAVIALGALGLALPVEKSPVLTLLEQTADYDSSKIEDMAEALQQSAAFNAAVSQQFTGGELPGRYIALVDRLTEIREDTIGLAGWMADGRMDLKEKLQLGWMKMRRGSAPERFAEVHATYYDLAKSVNAQITRELAIWEAYRYYRLALKTAETDALAVIEAAKAVQDENRHTLWSVGHQLETHAGDAVTRSQLELSQDEALRALQAGDKAFQIVKDLADDLKNAYNTADLVYTRLRQAITIKERLAQRTADFFATSTVVYSGLSNTFTANGGLADLGEGHDAALLSSSVRELAEVVEEYQTSCLRIVAELEDKTSRAMSEIAEAAEDGSRRFAELVKRATA